jgi:hypothetical protein
MRRRLVPLVAIAALAVPIGLMGGTARAAIPTPMVDYRFENNLRSSVHTQQAPKVVKISEDGLYSFGGGADRFLEWAEGAGLKINNGSYPIGSITNYTIAMKVKLLQISEYRKLVDLHNRKADAGWYQYSGYLYPYAQDIEEVDEPNPLPIQVDTVHTIVLTRAGGNVKGYVDGEQYFSTPDPEGSLALGPDQQNKVLSFFIDEVGGSEHGAGKIYRLRIWKDPLTNAQAEDL